MPKWKPSGLPLYHPLWFFSLNVYGQRGVAAQCLAWQNQRGMDVNLFLMCLWLQSLGHSLSETQFTEVAVLAEEWQRTRVAPLRAQRQALSREIQAAGVLWQPERYAERRGLLQQELLEEQREQALLWQWVCALGCRPPAEEIAASTSPPLDHLAKRYELAPMLLRERAMPWLG